MSDKKIHNPMVTVIMPVYNASAYLREAIDSVLNQTYTDFEFIIIDDVSTDDSWDIISSYSDDRIIKLQNKKNVKAGYSTNRGIDMARGKYIARMDADDISLPERFEKEVAYLEAHPKVGIVGGFVKIIGDDHEYVWTYETTPECVKARMLFQAPYANPTIMMRASFLNEHNLRYEAGTPFMSEEELWKCDSTFFPAEDYEFAARASECFEIANIPEVLLNYRVAGQNSSGTQYDIVKDVSQTVRKSLIEKLGITPSDQDMKIHRYASQYNAPLGCDLMKQLDEWFQKILTANTTTKRYDQTSLEKVIAHLWYGVCLNHLKEKYAKSVFSSAEITKLLSFKQKIKWMIKHVLKRK